MTKLTMEMLHQAMITIEEAQPFKMTEIQTGNIRNLVSYIERETGQKVLEHQKMCYSFAGVPIRERSEIIPDHLAFVIEDHAVVSIIDLGKPSKTEATQS